MRADSAVPSKKDDGRKVSVLVIDDLITAADSKWIAISALRRAGYDVAGVAVYLDREQGGFENVQGGGIPIVCVVKLRDALNFYAEEGLVSGVAMEKIRAYLKW
ncbi:MAG TPA: hypothetical protein VNM40_00305 [Candidatus Paceibacterota bacterium]|nr:hypothetical protein [Candidatus Paceibacterota bacterium]